MIRTRRLLEVYLALLAKLVVLRFRPKIIAVTGSVGKTTTSTIINGMLSGLAQKELIGSFRSNATSNMNCTVGVPLTILGSNHYLGPDFAGMKSLARLTGKTLIQLLNPAASYPEILLLECGISSKGEMARIARVVRPDLAIVTTVGHAHLERGMSTPADIATEKSKLVSNSRRGGLVLLGADNEWARGMAAVAPCKVRLVEGRGIQFGTSVAEIVAEWLGAPKEETRALLEQPSTPPHRLQRISSNGIIIIDDTHNANPLSMKLALDTLQAEQCPGRKIAVLGEMRELGRESEELHREIGEFARGKADKVLAVGGQLSRLYGTDYVYEDSLHCAQSIVGLVSEGDCVLVKGSHSINMLLVVHALVAE